MFIENKFNIGDFVYLKTDVDQKQRVITGINVRATGILYDVCQGSTSSWHYDFEMSEEKDVLITSNN